MAACHNRKGVILKKLNAYLFAALSALVFSTSSAWAQDLDAIKKTISTNFSVNIPDWPAVDEVSTTPIQGLYEVRLGDSEIIYTDETGNYIMLGNLVQTQGARNLTQERIDELTAVKFSDLSLDDAIVIKRGDGSRKIAVFEDPQCSYCHRFEQEFQSVDNVTVYVFLYPILSHKSLEQTQNIWCAADPAAAWQDWMLNMKEPAQASCDTTALQRNISFGRKYKITGTPTMIFEDGSRIPGAVQPELIEVRLQEASGKKK